MSNKVEIGQNIVLLAEGTPYISGTARAEVGDERVFFAGYRARPGKSSLDSLRWLSETLEVDIWVFFLYRQDEESILAVLHEARNVSGRQKAGVR